jgi:nucleotide-binding universal stress UspA family protein
MLRETDMNSARQPVVMVGVSGSSASAGALRWAADEARRRNAGLRVVRSWNIEGRAPYAPAAGGPAPAEQRAAASGELAAALGRAFGPKLPAGISAELVQGVPERILIDRSADAGLLVLGSAAPPAQGGRPVGPVVRACLHRAQCPVVVVGVPAEGRGGDERPGSAGPTGPGARHPAGSWLGMSGGRTAASVTQRRERR